MTTQSRQQGRRSLSVFTFGHFRSFSRAETQPAKPYSPNDSLRSPSSLSCNPHCQLPASPEPTTVLSNVVAEGVMKPPIGSNSYQKGLPHLRAKLFHSEEGKRTRPRSWFSFSRGSLRRRPTRSLSVPLPKDTSRSSVDRSVISAPVLTGTTNMVVAETEGVCCRDIVDVGLTTVAETKNSNRRSFVLEGVGMQEAHTTMFHLSGTPAAKRSRQERPRNLVVDTTDPNDLGRLSEDTGRLLSVEKSIARRHAETINLCKEKINKLTGHGRIKRKSVNKGELNTSALDDRADNGRILRVGDGNTARPHNYLTKSNGNDFFYIHHNYPDISVGSLTKSFASAIDKLDFHSLPTSSNMPYIPFVRSKSSIFSLRKRDKHPDGAETSKHGTKSKESINQTPVRVVGESNAEKLASLTMLEALKITPPAQSIVSRSTEPQPEPMQFSADANGYVVSTPVASYPRGVKVLGMHSNTMEFATAPSWITDLPKPPKNNPTVKEKDRFPCLHEDEEEDEDAIQDAPIYSPSSGDLSQYQRPTPSPAQTAKQSTHQTDTETPTHRPAEKGYMRRLGLRTSKSGYGLLSIFNKGHKEVKEVIDPLQARDVNRKLETPNRLKKSRSMNIAAMLRRGDSSSDKESHSGNETKLSSQSVKPSPLRYEAQSENVVEPQPPVPPIPPIRIVYAAQRRTPPRGNITPLEREKRRGIIGMPQEQTNVDSEKD